MTSLRGAVPFAGERYFRLSTNALVRYQDAAGETLLEAMAALEQSPGDTRRIRRMVWAALSHEGLTEEAAGDLMDEIGQTEAARLLGEAIRAAFPQADPQIGDAGGNGASRKKRTP
ncbi:hypothetical protein [Rhodobacter capsulatus]|uniref:hypothetical protein n=1 Tax=Rhodobacter capsulatus TaxID=1061 RepID=UPI0040270069